MNFTVDESEVHQASISMWLTGAAVVLSALNILLSIIASLGNALILVVLRNESSLHPPSKLLFQCLAIIDLCTGVISQPLFAVSILAHVVKIAYFKEGFIVIGYTLCGTSTAITAAISVDRLLALLLGLRYRHVVTLRRTRAVIVCLFVTGISIGSMHCWSDQVASLADIIFGLVSLTTSILSYTKIYLTLRQHQAQVHEHVNQGQRNGGGIQLNIARYKRSVAWVQLTLLICYLPFHILSITNAIPDGRGSGTESLSLAVTITLVYLNSSLNPILYCWKIREVKQAVKYTIRQFKFCCLSC